MNVERPWDVSTADIIYHRPVGFAKIVKTKTLLFYSDTSWNLKYTISYYLILLREFPSRFGTNWQFPNMTFRFDTDFDIVLFFFFEFRIHFISLNNAVFIFCISIFTWPLNVAKLMTAWNAETIGTLKIYLIYWEIV